MSNQLPFYAAIEAKLKKALSPDLIEIVDNSWMHVGHAGAQSGGRHLHISIVSSTFASMPILDRYQLIHEILKEDIGHGIHALELSLSVPS